MAALSAIVGMAIGHAVMKQRLMAGTISALVFTSMIWGYLPHVAAIEVLAVGILCCGGAERAFRLRVSRSWVQRTKSEGVKLVPPFRGTWVVAAGGPIIVENHHIFFSDQQYAADFVRKDAASWNSEILAPIAGTVVNIVDGIPDETDTYDVPAETIARNPFGNHIVLEVAPSTFLFLCHFRLGSIAVEMGALVPVGAEIGRCGNSGRSRGPHLHMHAQDTPSQALDKAKGIPIQLEPYAYPAVGQMIYNVPWPVPIVLRELDHAKAYLPSNARSGSLSAGVILL